MGTNDAPSMNPALRDFWLTPSRHKVLYGGRASSKSWDAAAHSVRVAQTVRVRVLCTRMFQNKIEESVYTTIKTQIERFGLSEKFEILNTKINCLTTGSEFMFYGLSRNIEEIKSLEGIDILWIEEAHALTPKMWSILYPTIRAEGSEIWVVFNPRFANDFAYRTFVLDPPRDTIVRKINYDENPFLSETALQDIEDLKERDYDEYVHVYKGEPKTDDDSVIIKRSHIEAAIDAHRVLDIEPTGVKMVGFDVADDGDDKNATSKRHGILISAIDEWKGGEDMLLESCQRAYRQAQDQGAEVTYDSIGVGATAGSKFKEINNQEKDRRKHVRYHAFNAGGKVMWPDKEYQPGVLNKDHFANVKAQAWWTLADRFRATYAAVVQGKDYDPSEIISISSECEHIERLVTELSSPRKDFDGAGRVKVESKQDMIKRGLKSPNLADAVVMCFAPTEKKPEALSSWL